MPVFRVGARLDLKPPKVVKGIQMEGLRVIGDPVSLAKKYYLDGADELFVQDVVASLYGKASEHELVSKLAEGVFVPITVGGGLRTVEDAVQMVESGADRVGFNSGIVRYPGLLAEVADHLGVQANVAVVEAKKTSADSWEVLIDGGRERSGLDVARWLADLESLGAGEIVVVSVDRDGTLSGPDWELAQKARSATNLRLLYQGGVSRPEDAVIIADLGFEGVFMAAGLHYESTSIGAVKAALLQTGFGVRV